MSAERFCSGCSRWVFSREAAADAVRQTRLDCEARLATLQKQILKLEQKKQYLRRNYEDQRRAYENLKAGAASMDVDSRRVIPSKIWKKLVSLTHPDKHDNSRTATEVTQWLMEVRP